MIFLSSKEMFINRFENNKITIGQHLTYKPNWSKDQTENYFYANGYFYVNARFQLNEYNQQTANNEQQQTTITNISQI